MSIVVNKWRMDPSQNALIHCETGEIRRLGEYHYLLLETLAKNADTVLSRSYLMTEVWKNRVVGSNSLPTAIHALRVAIDDDGKQQEIIKTIPKKGYLFNNAYLSVIDSAEDTSLPVTSKQNSSESFATGDGIIPADEEDKNSATTPTVNPIESAPLQTSGESVPPLPRRMRLRIVLSVMTLTVIIVAAVAFLFYRDSPPGSASVANVPKIIKEKYPLADRVEINHVLTAQVNNTQPAPLPKHIEPGIIKANEALLAHNATMRLFYKTSFNKFALTLVVKNQCGNSWQLILNFENWQSKENEMNDVLFQEVEKMLNDMPKCA
ncbi:winged helix-turn-helix domain-containing protein [Citrobacter amalonaticus]|uniref:transcriptional regulator n=1 Tax=Citrobacter amalonaticus TaxID=35703 RepID=UPI001908CCF8|nr:winged helix-turn-helix domain-containing protein [Citrobacter amalonaticus]MBJ9329359.1 winged helix-turn-helix domain-containing protein [Citrobacter amalonaticus]